MALNPDKSESILFGTRQRSNCYTLTSVDFAEHSIPLKNQIKILGAVLDKHLTLDAHTTSICKSSYYHIRAIRHIRSAITDDMARSIAIALVGSRLDYANSILYGTTKQNINRLQRVQNTLARVVCTSSTPTSSFHLLHKLHWLPFEYRIKFKLATLTHRIISSNEPAYLRSLISHYTPIRTLRSADSHRLAVPFASTAFGARAFSVAAPSVWNSLPPNVRATSSLQTFRHLLKTHFFHLAFSHL